MARSVRIRKILLLIILLYLFLCGISLMGKSLKLFGKGFSENLIATTSNPAIGLMIGLLATAVIQSSSTTTSIVVGFVASGIMDVRVAVPIIMGANIGTTVTSFLVSFLCISRKDEFERAIAGATIHDFFNILAVLILFPLEMTTHFLEKTARFITGYVDVFGGGVSFHSPVKVAIKPFVNFLLKMNESVFDSHVAGKILLLAISILLIFFALYFLVKIMKTLILSKTEMVFHNIVGRNAVIGIFMGMLFTILVQSSSVTTAILVPLIAARLITLEDAFPLTLGANIGTTITAILASLSGDTINGFTISLVHLLFNVSGIILIYPLQITRRVPLFLAKKMGQFALRSKLYPLAFLICVYFLIPGLLIYLFR